MEKIAKDQMREQQYRVFCDTHRDIIEALRTRPELLQVAKKLLADNLLLKFVNEVEELQAEEDLLRLVNKLRYAEVKKSHERLRSSA